MICICACLRHVLTLACLSLLSCHYMLCNGTWSRCRNIPDYMWPAPLGHDCGGRRQVCAIVTTLHLCVPLCLVCLQPCLPTNLACFTARQVGPCWTQRSPFSRSPSSASPSSSPSTGAAAAGAAAAGPAAALALAFALAFAFASALTLAEIFTPNTAPNS